MNWKQIAVVVMATAMVLSITPLAETDAEGSESVYQGESKTYNVPSGTELRGFILDKIWEEGNWITYHDEGRNYIQLIMTDLTLVLEEGGTYYIRSTFEGQDTENASNMANFSGDSLTIIGNGATVLVENETSLTGGRHDENYIPTTDESVTIRSVNLTIEDVNFKASGSGSVAFSFSQFPSATVTGCTFSGLWITFGANLADDPSVSLQGCTFNRDGITDDYSALYFNYVKAVSIDDCDVADSPGGINFRPRLDGASLSLTNSEFRNVKDVAVQLGECNEGQTVSMDLEGNTFSNCGIGLRVHEVAKAEGSIESSNNEYRDCVTDFAIDAKPSIKVNSNQDRFEKDGIAVSTPSMIDGEGNRIQSDVVTVIDPVEDPLPPVIWDDDDELPPFIPSQTGGDDDTVTIVACAAAAAVAAIMAVFLIIDRKQ